MNRNVHLHACVTDGVLTQSSDSYSATFFPARPITTADLATLTEHVRRRVVDGGHAVGGQPTEGCCDANQKPRSHDTSRIAWANLMARAGEKFPLECPACGGDIRLLTFITEPRPLWKILIHLGEPLEPPPISPTRGPPTD